MQTKGAIGLVAAAAVSVVVAAAVAFSGGSAPIDPRVGKPVLPELVTKPGEIAKIVLKHGAATISLIAPGADSGTAWTVAEKGNYPADREKIRKLLLGLATIAYVEPKTAKPDLYPRLQVEDPGAQKSQSTLVEVDDAKGAVLGTVIVGRRRIDELGGGNDGVYVRLPGEAQSWLARGTLDLETDTVQWLDRRVVDIDQKRIAQAVLTHDGETLTITRDKPEDKFSLKELPANRTLKSDTTLVEPATVLSALDLTDVRKAADLPFPKDGIATATYKTFDGLTVQATILKQGEADWMTLGATAAEGNDKAQDEAKTLNAKWSPWVYGIPSYKANALRTKLADVLAPAPAPAQTSQNPPAGPATPPGAAPKKAK